MRFREVYPARYRSTVALLTLMSFLTACGSQAGTRTSAAPPAATIAAQTAPAPVQPATTATTTVTVQAPPTATAAATTGAGGVAHPRISCPAGQIPDAHWTGCVPKPPAPVNCQGGGRFEVQLNSGQGGCLYTWASGFSTVSPPGTWLMYVDREGLGECQVFHWSNGTTTTAC
jgi:hypothetical protein